MEEMLIVHGIKIVAMWSLTLGLSYPSLQLSPSTHMSPLGLAS